MKVVLVACTLGIISTLPSCSPRENQPERSSSTKELPRDVVARVNGESITRSELDSHLSRVGTADRNQELRDAALQELVLERMVRQSAMKYGITVSETELDLAVRREMDKNSHFPEPRCEGCTKTRSAAEFREDQRYRLLEAKVFAHYAGEGVLKNDPVSESAIRAYYDAHRDQCRGAYADDRAKIASMLTNKKRDADRDQLVRFLFQRFEVIPKSLTALN